MSEVLERVSQLPGLVAGMLPHATDIARLGDAELADFVSALGRAIATLQGSAAIAAAVVDARSARELGADSLARRAGVKSGAELVQRLTGSSLGDAKKAVRVGVMLETAASVAPVDSGDAGPGPRSIEALRSLGGAWSAPVAVAVRNGWLTAECGDRLTTGLGTPRPGCEPDWRAAALRLIEDTWDGALTPEDVERAAKATRACLDRDWAQHNAARLHEQRSLKRTVRGDGMVKYDLLLDPLTDAQIWTPIHRHLAPRLGGPRFLTDEERQRAAELEQDARSNEQLLADTFTAFLTAGVTASNTFGKYTPTVNIAVTTSELKKAITADQARQKSAPPDGNPPAPPRGDPPPADGIAWIDGRPEPLTGAQLIAALCDGSTAAILLDATGQTLDATKADRTFSTRQRRALAIRDGGCRMPGCPIPAHASEAHHLNPWAEHPDNHTTETRDGILLCRFHHLTLHAHGGRIHRHGTTYHLTWPGQEPIRLQPKHALITQLRTEGALP